MLADFRRLLLLFSSLRDYTRRGLCSKMPSAAMRHVHAAQCSSKLPVERCGCPVATQANEIVIGAMLQVLEWLDRQTGIYVALLILAYFLLVRCAGLWAEGLDLLRKASSSLGCPAALLTCCSWKRLHQEASRGVQRGLPNRRERPWTVSSFSFILH